MILISILILFKIYYELKWLDLLLGIFKLETGKKEIASVSQKSLMYIVKRGTDDEVFYKKMREMGWEFTQVYGRGYLFEKRGEEVLVTKREYGKYSVYEIHGKSYFLTQIGKLA